MKKALPIIGALLLIGITLVNKREKIAVELIKKVEGFSATPYKDTGGVWTIGYGHAIKKGEGFNHVTPEIAETLLRQDMKDAKDAIDKLVTAPLNDNQYAALWSFVYNIGETQFKKSTLLRRLNDKKYELAAAEFSRWVYDNGKRIEGLANRRAIEKELFLRA